MAIRDIVQAAAGNTGEAIYVEDVFSTYLYTGNGTGRTVKNNIALGNNYGGGAFFDGTGDTLTKTGGATALQFGTGNFTIEFWFNSYGVISTAFAVFFEFYINGGQGQIIAIQKTSSTGTNMIYVEAGSIMATTSGVNPFDGAWHHHAIVRNGSTVNYYIDGISRASVASTYNVNSGDSFKISGYSGGSGYDVSGSISNLRVVKGTAVYTTTFTPPTAPLTAISGTQLLILQSPSVFTDYSTNAFSVVVAGNTYPISGGPFTDATLGYGGLVWCKDRTVANDNNLFDTVRGANYRLISNATNSSQLASGTVTAFNSDGFSVGNAGGSTNRSGGSLVSWAFRKAEKFFDVVTFVAGSSTDRRISHSLGSVPGFWIMKAIDLSGMNWPCYHTSLGLNNAIDLNLTGAASPGSNRWGSAPTSTTLGINEANMCVAGYTYILYIFANDAGGFGNSGDQSVIKCGSYTTDGSGNATVNLGWEPQWVLSKASSSTSDWRLWDNMRPFTTTNASYLEPNTSDAEADNSYWFQLRSNGFYSERNANTTYIYIAIRRGPMKTPEVGTEVFNTVFSASSGEPTFIPGFPVDWGTWKFRNFAAGWNSATRLTGPEYLEFNSTAAGANYTPYDFDYSNGWASAGQGNSTDLFSYCFQRAPGFFDVVCYTGTGSAGLSISHNLGVAPELMIIKRRNTSVTGWQVGTQFSAANFSYLTLNTNTARDIATYNVGYGWYAQPTATAFTLDTYQGTNEASSTYVAYLFATCPGVSKVGSYTGTGTTQQINCGFTTGARFVMIKRTSGIGDWFVWDSARGIVAGDDPYLLLNSTAAEVTNTDYVDTYSAGFEITSTAPATINANGGTFIFLAIA